MLNITPVSAQPTQRVHFGHTLKKEVLNLGFDLVCDCANGSRGVSKLDLLKAMQQGHMTLNAISRATGAGQGCKCCMEKRIPDAIIELTKML